MGKLTMLTGPTSSGKTSVFRAINALLRNDPVTRYITYGEKQLKVKLTLDSGITVEWIKGNGDNSYIVHWPDGRESTFQKVGNDVPDEVAEVLKLTPIKMEDGNKLSVNVHSQLESPFLVKDTAPQVAKVFGELTSASKLYAAVSEGNKTVLRNRSLKKTRNGDLELVHDQLRTDFTDLEEQSRTLEDLKRIRSELAEVFDNGLSTTIIKGQMLLVEDKTSVIENQIGIVRVAADVEVAELESVSNAIFDLLHLRSNIQANIVAERNMTSELQAIKDAQSVTYLSELLVEAQQISDCSQISSQLDLILNKTDECSSNLHKLRTACITLDRKIEKLYTDLEECPACGQALGQDAKSHLLDESLV